MTQSINVNTKKRGRPATTGKGIIVGVRMQPDQIAQVDEWIAALPDPKPTRPEAVRRLVAEALSR